MMQAALAIARRGIAVFPLAPLSNKPLKDSHGHLDATTGADRVAQWWAAHPDANIGARTGPGFAWVLDVDPRAGGDETLARLEAEHGPLPATVESATPRDGRHLFWKWPADGAVIDCCAGRIGPGIDHRGQGGGIPLPPSRRRDGLYRWTCRGPMIDAPAWLVGLAVKPAPPPRPAPKPMPKGKLDRYVAAAVARELVDLGAAGAGQRNQALNRAAYALAGFCLAGALPADWARAELASTAVAIGLPAVEAERTIASAWAAAQPRELPTR